MTVRPNRRVKRPRRTKTFLRPLNSKMHCLKIRFVLVRTGVDLPVVKRLRLHSKDKPTSVPLILSDSQNLDFNLFRSVRSFRTNFLISHQIVINQHTLCLSSTYSSYNNKRKRNFLGR